MSGLGWFLPVRMDGAYTVVRGRFDPGRFPQNLMPVEVESGRGGNGVKEIQKSSMDDTVDSSTPLEISGPSTASASHSPIY